MSDEEAEKAEQEFMDEIKQHSDNFYEYLKINDPEAYEILTNRKIKLSIKPSIN
jgi:hypothetical protein